MQIPAVQVGVKIRSREKLADQQVRSPLRQSAARRAREHSVEVLFVIRHDEVAAFPKSLEVNWIEHYNRARDFARVELLSKL